MAANIFAKIGDIKGESLDDKHKDEVEVLSWSWGVSQSGSVSTGGGGGAGKAIFSDFNFTHHLDKASPSLLKACATGEHIKEATITVRKAGKGQQEFLIIKMSDIIVTGVQSGRQRRGEHVRRERRASVRESRPGIQAAEVRRVARCRDPFQIRHQGQQGRVTTTTDRPVSLDEAVAIAIRLQQSDQWVAAGEMYRRILDAAPDYPDAVHYSGVLAHQEGRSEEAVALMRRSLELAPDRADWHSNLGIVLRDRLELDEAVAACRRAIALDAGHANAHNNLGVLLRAQGNVVEAEAAYRAAIRVSPDHSDAYTNLGILLTGQKRTREAAVCFFKVITLRPKHPEARRLLALAHCALGEVNEAVAIFEEWLREEPDHPIARHMMAACSGRDVPARASDAFIELTFDSFAGSFDAKLARLHYRAPTWLRRCWPNRWLRPRSLSTSSMPAAVPACAGRSSPRMRAGWSASTSLRRCWHAPGPGVSTTSSSNVSSRLICASPPRRSM